MPFANYIYEYFSGIQSGKYTVGKWVRLIYEIIISVRSYYHDYRQDHSVALFRRKRTEQ